MSWFRDSVPQGGYSNSYGGGSYSGYSGYSGGLGQSRSIPACICAIIAAICGWYAGEVGMYSAGFAIFIATGQIFQDLRIRRAHEELLRNSDYTLQNGERIQMAEQSAGQAADLAAQLDQRLSQVEGKGQ